MGNCADCRFWSDRLAMAVGGGPLTAMCLNAESPSAWQYTTGAYGCQAWKSGQYGAVDSRGEEDEIKRLYAEDDAVEREHLQWPA